MGSEVSFLCHNLYILFQSYAHSRASKFRFSLCIHISSPYTLVFSIMLWEAHGVPSSVVYHLLTKDWIGQRYQRSRGKKRGQAS